MIEYKRFISYMYTYVNGEKKHNSGYAKIEAKNGTCKLSVNIKSNTLNGETLNIYIFYRDETKESIIAIPAGTSVVKNNICDCIFKTDKENIFSSNLKLDNMSGVIVTSSDGRFFATEWDDISINPSEFRIHASNTEKIIIPSQNKKQEQKIEQNNIDLVDEEFLKTTKPIKPTIPKKIKSPILNDMVDIELQTSSIDSPQPHQAKEDDSIEKNKSSLDIKSKNEILNKNTQKNKDIKPFPVPKDNVNMQKNDLIPNQNSSKKISTVNRIFEYLPGMYPFEDDEIIDCVKIEPHDIGMFPMDKWILANNSFLLHGYYTYRHLIFARKRSKEHSKYILGVPGLYRDRDRFMANMFGFSEFKSVRNVPRSIGDFGYWYMEIRL